MPRRLILVRHAAVADVYTGVCYGQQDVELSAEGERRSRELVDELLSLQPDFVWSSDLQRAKRIAEPLAERAGRPLHLTPLLRELCFGSWELQTWDALFQQHGHALQRLLEEPDTFSPAGGETTSILQQRVTQWYRQLPGDGVVVAVAHGGPIAAIRGSLADVPPRDWPGLIPALGTWVEVG